MRETSIITRDMDWVVINIIMETIMRVNGIWTRLVEKACSDIIMEMSILANQ
jgi:hypothetical protein